MFLREKNIFILFVPSINIFYYYRDYFHHIITNKFAHYIPMSITAVTTYETGLSELIIIC